MTLHRRLLAAAALVLLSCPPAYGQDSARSIVTLYIASVAHPERFDDSLALAFALQDRAALIGCLNPLTPALEARAEDRLQDCDRNHERYSAANWVCIIQDEDARLPIWTQSMALVLGNPQSYRWLDLPVGKVLAALKRAANATGAGTWERSVRASEPQLEEVFVCR